MSEKKNQVVEESTQELAANAAPEVVTGMVNNTFDEIVSKLSADKRNKVYRNLFVKNIVVNMDDEDRPRICLVLREEIAGYVLEGTEYKLGKTHNAFVTAFAIAAVLKEDESTAMMGNYIVRNPRVAENLLSGATINLIQVPIKAGEGYINPFTTKTDSEEYVSDHDWISNNITSIKLGVMGNKVVDRLIDRIVDAML